MSSRRTLILVGAIAVGAIAALLIVNYVGSVQDKANTASQLVPVVVVKGTGVKKGESADTAIAEKRIDIDERRQQDLPANVVTRIEDIKGQTAGIDLSAGEVVTTAQFGGNADLGSSKSSALDPGQVAITASVPAGNASGGLIQPGDFVNILVVKKGADANTPTAVTTLYQKVKVLALGTNLGTAAAAPGDAATPTTAPAASDLVTFAVPLEAAQLISAVVNGGDTSESLGLVLVRPDYQPKPTPSSANAGVPPGELGFTPYDGQPSTAEPTPGATK